VDFYSVTLGLALGAGSAALAAALSAWLARERSACFAVTRVLAALALVAAFASGLNHRLTGHAGGTPEALAPLAFFAAHPALLVAAALAISALALERAQRFFG
jgi:hypothetical protein